MPMQLELYSPDGRLIQRLERSSHPP
jgi:hypothetical protein